MADNHCSPMVGTPIHRHRCSFPGLPIQSALPAILDSSGRWWWRGPNEHSSFWSRWLQG